VGGCPLRMNSRVVAFDGDAIATLILTPC